MDYTGIEPPYDLIMADPPWEYDFSKSKSRRVENQYPTMKLHEIVRVPVREWAARDCVLFLWSPAPKIREALKVMARWRFKYKTNVVWDKQVIGMGYYARGRHELLLIGTRGRPALPLPKDKLPSVLSERRTRHSRKPQEAYRLIEQGWPTYRKLELFARERRAGWDSWGNELEVLSAV